MTNFAVVAGDEQEGVDDHENDVHREKDVQQCDAEKCHSAGAAVQMRSVEVLPEQEGQVLKKVSTLWTQLGCWEPLR